MSKLTMSILTALALVLPAYGAVDLPTNRPITVQECISYALEHHNDVLAAEQDLRASKAGVQAARSGYMPYIYAGSDYSDGGTTGGSYLGSGDSKGTKSTVGIQETLYDGGRTLTSIRQASAQATVSEAEMDLTRQARILSVTTAYFDSLRSKRLAEIAAGTVKESQQQLEMIQARIDAGDAAKVDRYPVEVQLANTRLNQLQAENEVRLAANTLRNAMGLGRGPMLPLVDLQEPTDEVPALEECLTVALKQRPELVRSSAQVTSAQASLWLAKVQRLPVPTISAGYERGLGGTEYDGQWSVGIGVTMNIFDAGSAAAEVTSSKARVDSTALKADQLLKDICTEVEQAYLNLTNARERLAASRPSVELAQTNLEVAREKYRQELAIPLEIVSAEVSYADAQASHAQALYDSYIAQAQLDKAIGKRGY